MMTKMHVPIQQSDLEEAVPCVRCGYDLRGREPEEVCPECGLAVERGRMLGQALTDSRPRWIMEMAVAAAILLVCQIWACLVAEASLHRFSEGLALTYLFVLAMVQWAASCVLARAENPYARARRDWLLAGSIRIGTALPLVVSALAISIFDQGLSHSQWLVLVPFTLFAPCLALQFAILRRLAGRAGNGRLTEYSAIVGIGYPAAVVLAFIGAPLLDSWREKLSSVIAGLIITLLIFFWGWAMVTLAYFVATLGRIAVRARRAWTAADHSASLGH